MILELQIRKPPCKIIQCPSFFEHDVSLHASLCKEVTELCLFILQFRRILLQYCRWFQQHPWVPASPERSSSSSLPFSPGSIQVDSWSDFSACLLSGQPSATSQSRPPGLRPSQWSSGWSAGRSSWRVSRPHSICQICYLCTIHCWKTHLQRRVHWAF